MTDGVDLLSTLKPWAKIGEAKGARRSVDAMAKTINATL